MKSTKKCDSTQHKISISNKRRSSAGMFNTSSAGAVTSLILMLALVAIFGLTGTNQVYATTSTLTISVIDSISLSILPNGSTGTFATSDTTTNNISVTTNNGTGYELGIKASSEGSNALINSSDSNKTIPSITTAISESTYSTSTTYNNTWGFRPSKLNSVANSNYLPAPTSASTATTIDKTSVANPSTANTYNLSLGVRVNNSTAPGSYSNTFVLTVVANPALYSITYNKNTTDTVTNMPSNITNQETSSETVNIASQVPVRDGYIFKGWCTTQTADGDTCSGTTYNPYGGGTALTWILNQTVSSNSLALYAVWESVGPCKPTGTTILTIVCMQDISANNKTAVLNSMTQGTQYKLIDRRDSKEYYVAKLPDGNIWMTQNLDLDLSTSTTLTPINTDIPADWTPNRSTYATSNKTWIWLVYDPESYDPGNKCWNGNINTSWNGTLDNMTQTCTSGHYHIGNFYNWTAAVAMNDSSSYTVSSTQDANQSICPAGWRLPTGDGSKSYQNLINGRYTATPSGNIQKSPVYFAYGGRWGGTSFSQYVGTLGEYWTSAPTGRADWYQAAMLYFDVDQTGPGYAANRDVGIAVRCVAR